jgi:hypothetical protein
MADRLTLNDPAGAAALGICESLLHALTDGKVISQQEVRGLLTDVVTTHEQTAEISEMPEKHHAVVAIVQRMLDSMNATQPKR